ncbi:MAG: glycosyltransferase [Planctomycetota bacterium]|jgi:UDP-N-acetylglucosamine transferase subunit ALG13
MIFLTVGTQFPFDRLVEAVDRAVDYGLIDEDIFAQIGESAYQPHNFEAVRFMDKRVFDQRLQNASGVISHAGIGIITLALDNNKPLLVMPRLKRHGEVVNDHQVAIAKKLAQLGYVLAASNVEHLQANMKKLATFVPRKRTTNSSAVIGRITKFLFELSILLHGESNAQGR